MEWMEVVDVINGKTENFENCVYLWRNKVDGKLYVGQAKDFRERTKGHKYGAFNENQKYNHNVPLHRAIRKYGIKKFEICILEKNLNDYDEMNKKEIYYIEKFDTLVKNGKGYNLASGGGNANPYAGKTEVEMKEIIRKWSEARSGENNPMYGCTGENNPRSRAVVLFNTGEVFNCIKQAEEKYGIANSSIVDCCKGKRKSAGLIDGKPAIWMYYSDYEKLSEKEIAKIKNEEVPNDGRPKAVICVTTGKIYESIMEAEKQTGVTHSNIVHCCKGKHKSAGVIDGKTAVWMYLEDYEKLSKEEVNKIKNQELPNGSRPKAVICITTGKIYESIMEAERQTGVDHRNINACCRAKRKSAGKDENGNRLVWMYLDEYYESK